MTTPVAAVRMYTGAVTTREDGATTPVGVVTVGVAPRTCEAAGSVGSAVTRGSGGGVTRVVTSNGVRVVVCATRITGRVWITLVPRVIRSETRRSHRA